MYQRDNVYDAFQTPQQHEHLSFLSHMRVNYCMEDGFVNDDQKIINGTSTKPTQTDTINSKNRWESRGGSGLVSALQLGHV